MILVAGGAGRLGAVVVRGLTDRGERVRVLTREGQRAEPLRGPLVDVVLGDVRDPGSLTPAMADVTVVVSAVHGFAGPGRVTPRSVDRDGNVNLVAAAESAGADVVLVSVIGAAPDHPLELFRMKAEAEACLLASAVGWTVVRADAFLELYLDLLRTTASKTGRPVVFGRGNNPVRFVRIADVAAAVIAATLDRSQRGQVVEVAGQELTLNQLAAQVQEEMGSADRPPRHVPVTILRALAATRHLTNAAGPRQAHAALLMDTITMGTPSDPKEPAPDDSTGY